jgi:hypothetical protein
MKSVQRDTKQERSNMQPHKITSHSSHHKTTTLRIKKHISRTEWKGAPETEHKLVNRGREEEHLAQGSQLGGVRRSLHMQKKYSRECKNSREEEHLAQGSQLWGIGMGLQKRFRGERDQDRQCKTNHH